MESILAKALESKLKYWLRSFTRDQFKLHGRSVLLHNLDLNGDALHATIGLPPTLRVTQARVGKLEIKLPTVSNVKTEPVVVDIDKLDLVLIEQYGNESDASVAGNHSFAGPTKSYSYGFADQIADGMTVQVGIVNLMLETRGGSHNHGEAAWTPPLASITMHKLLLYTTNELWKVVNLKEARNFFSDKKCIYVFKKLEWESISIDLLPHPDMFTDESLSSLSPMKSKRDNDGAKRLFFGGERFLENVSGAANITIHRTEQNNPLGLEVQFHIPEALCPALSEPGLRAFLRFMTGMYVCLNRGDLDPKAQQVVAEGTGRTLVGVSVDHILLCITDADFRLELILQSLYYLRGSSLDGECTKTMVQIMLGSMFIRDTFSQPSCTLMQPSMQCISNDFFPVPKFATDKFWPRIYPLDAYLVPQSETPPMLSMYSHNMMPAPAPPTIASQTVIQCQPIKVNLQEKSCIQIASFLADGIVVEHGVVLPDTSLNSMMCSVKEFDLTIPMNPSNLGSRRYENYESAFTGARLHVEDFVFAESPTLTYRLLKLENDPVCFPLWRGQPVDASQKRWVMRARYLSVALETQSCDDSANTVEDSDWAAGLWRCLEMQEPCLEAAMVSADGRPLITVPPPGGVVRLGIICKRYCFNASVEQLLFVLKMYSYMVEVSAALLRVTKSPDIVASLQLDQGSVPEEPLKKVISLSMLIESAPGDSTITLHFDVLEVKLLESLPNQPTLEGPPLVRVWSAGICFEVSYRPLGGAAAVSSTLNWQDIRVECVDAELESSTGHASTLSGLDMHRDEVLGEMPESNIIKESPQTPMPKFPTFGSPLAGSVLKHSNSKMRPVFWITDGNCSKQLENKLLKESGSGGKLPFLDIKVVHVIPYEKEDAEHHSLRVMAKIAGVRLGGGMIYNEALLHRFGVLASDGGAGKEVKRVLKELSSGPLGEFLKPTPRVAELNVPGNSTEMNDDSWTLTKPEDIELDFQLLDWLFALEGAEGLTRMSEITFSKASSALEESCWHLSFHRLRVTAFDTGRTHNLESSPLPKINLEISGVCVMKPQVALFGAKSSLDQSLNNGFENAILQSAATLGPAPYAHDEFIEAGIDKTNAISGICDRNGLDLELRLLLQEDGARVGLGEWKVESLRAAVTQPVEMEATKDEVENLVMLIKLEIEAASRIAAGILMLLELHGSLGQAAIEHLSNLGSGSLDNILTPERARRFSVGSVSSTPSHLSLGASANKKAIMQNSDSTLFQLEQALQKSQELCSKLKRQLTETSYSDDVSLLADQINDIQDLIPKLKDQGFC
ncbi:hypothetical protein O6H91_10G063200 [Diphasiastrum complanatum]|uniref:Uncharacterized protein n=2 Tax=Diphasiastrum complanatum TaxID=34168 RepID=A0ACC2CHS9_DIPCM|nr:hypothetical protein O6H91_10G063200 [Diphasiastrum complanatum]KAJ7541506.1 hypothetical protein O6H91_10G063200 [Diphasiastrum complanatum]